MLAVEKGMYFPTYKDDCDRKCAGFLSVDCEYLLGELLEVLIRMSVIENALGFYL